MENPPRNDDSRFLDALKGFGKSLVAGLAQRLDLFSVELEEEQRHLLTVLFLVLATALSAFMAFLCLNLVVILLSWEGNRLLVALMLATFYIALAGGAALWLRRVIGPSHRPFAASLEEFRKDCASITGEDT